MNNKTNNNQVPDEALKLLPWYATGWLTPKERSYVQKMLSKYPDLQDELKIERTIIQYIKEDESLLDLSIIESPEKRLKNVLSKLENNQPEVTINRSETTFERLKKLLTNTIFTHEHTKFQYAAVATITFLSIALLYAFISPLVSQKNTFYPATVATVETKAEVNGTILLVGLNTDSSDPELQGALRGVNAKIDVVSGKDGMYRIYISKKLNAAETKALINKLTAKKELVWFAGEAY